MFDLLITGSQIIDGTGNVGCSYAPFKTADDLLRFVDLNSGLDGRPPLPAPWSSVADYLALFDEKVAVNTCYIVGNSPLRIATVPATRREPKQFPIGIEYVITNGKVAADLST